MKKYNVKPRGYVNHGGASTEKDRERLRKLGKNYNSIDFGMSTQMNETWSECSKIMETLQDAQLTHRQKIRLGMF